ncbi:MULTISPECIES: hypothetical protein [Actinosynnema]|uniref:hypothetical protein n=1 Tax=Actinosynnema TaxID=40566 RepID=UPI0020A56294|nr:hypothetical protein [Actinosynnema pretiosum]MCP2092708.1 hypothetical protein [Actinosynnema pretiosum]
MTTEDVRVLLIDLENAVGAIRPRPRVLRGRVGALLGAAGPVHHAIAGYSGADLADDPTASLLAELGVGALRVAPAQDAAENALLAHAHRVHDALGCRVFVVASADRRFAELAALGRLELLAWADQPIAAKLLDVAHELTRVPRPSGAPQPGLAEHEEHPVDPAPDAFRPGLGTLGAVVAALLVGVGIGVGQRVVEAVGRGARHGGRVTH